MIVDGNNVISHYLKNNKPFCAGKIGVTELNILNYGYQPYLKHEAEDIAGLYPFNTETANKFRIDMVNALGQIDLIPKWSKVNPDFEKSIFANCCPKAYITKLQHLEPYFFDKPWTNYLEGKKVLVFSPFAISIIENFLNLSKIWNNKINPNFILKAHKYPFALKIQPNLKYNTSDEVYQEYLKVLQQEDFDIGIFGTGYTSLLFAAECKKLGKAGIHLGGSTQILFGIKGQRWREIKEFQSFFNNHWTDPLPNELPEKRNLCENACYW